MADVFYPGQKDYIAVLNQYVGATITGAQANWTATMGSAGYIQNKPAIDQVNNTSDLNKPISIATQTALDLKDTTNTFSRRNRFRNGNFRIAQRGTSSLPTNAYTADGWYVVTGGSGLLVNTAATGSLEGTTVNLLNLTGAAGNTGSLIRQGLEANVSRDMAGKTIVVSYWYFQDTGASATVSTQINYYSALDNPSSTTSVSQTNAATVVPSGTFTKVIAVFSLPSAAMLGMSILLGVNSPALLAGKNIYYANAQVEIGSVPTLFEARGDADQLLECKRYFYKQIYYLTVTKSGAGGQFSSVTWPVEMRATPSVTYSGFSDQDSSGATSVSFLSPSSTGAGGFVVAGTITAGSRILVTASLSAELS